MAIAEGQWREVALSDNEYRQILELMGREPSEVELGMFGAMWSEHCGYKHSRPHLRNLPTEAPWVVQGPGENAGAVDIGNGLAAVFKVESHNHPSAVEPYEGAATGVGGIVRDIFTMGARPIGLLNGLRFGDPLDPRNRYLFTNVVAGIGGYGNTLGIPTVGGEIAFDKRFNGNPIVNAMAVGLVPIDGIVRAKASGVGNVLMLIGAETGRDGVHGATFASVDDPEASHRGVIQVGNPFLEKQLMEACLELLQGDAVVAMQDLGAAGLTSSVVESASRGGVGVEIDVAKVPRREEGMSPYEVMLSESQERMVLVAPPERVDEISAVLDKWSLSSAVIGHVTDDGVVRVRDGEETYVEVPVRYFIDECPTYPGNATEPQAMRERRREDPLASVTDVSPDQLRERLVELLGSPNVGSRRPVWEQYDHTILTNTVAGPGAADAAVLRVKGIELGIAMSMDCNSRYCDMDPYIGAMHAVAEAARNVACAGARPLGITNCLNLGNPERSPGDWHLKRVVEGIGDACRALDIPVVSGNVSLYNETAGVPIQPTPMIGCVGALDDVSNITRISWSAGDEILLLGASEQSLAGSEYLFAQGYQPTGAVPAIDFEHEQRLHQLVQTLSAGGHASGIHDVSLGGLAVALAEFALASNQGATIATPPAWAEDRLDYSWFAEGAGRVLVACAPDQVDAIHALADAHQIHVTPLGTVGGSSLQIEATEIPLDLMRNAHESALLAKEAVRTA